MSFPKITPGEPKTYNRKYRRALRAIAMLPPGNRFAKVSQLIGLPPRRAERPEHNRMVLAFLVGLKPVEAVL